MSVHSIKQSQQKYQKVAWIGLKFGNDIFDISYKKTLKFSVFNWVNLKYACHTLKRLRQQSKKQNLNSLWKKTTTTTKTTNISW
jgi:hypothetical protein